MKKPYEDEPEDDNDLPLGEEDFEEISEDNDWEDSDPFQLDTGEDEEDEEGEE